MAAMSLNVGAVLDGNAWIEYTIQAARGGSGSFASVRLCDGEYGSQVSLIFKDPAVLDALAAAVLAARDELATAHRDAAVA